MLCALVIRTGLIRFNTAQAIFERGTGGTAAGEIVNGKILLGFWDGLCGRISTGFTEFAQAFGYYPGNWNFSEDSMKLFPQSSCLGV